MTASNSRLFDIGLTALAPLSWGTTYGVTTEFLPIQPLLVMLFAWVILSEKPSRLAVVAAIAGFIGVGLLVLGPSAQLDTLGVAAALWDAGAMGLGTVLVKRWQPPVSLTIFTVWQLAIGGLMLLPVALITEGPFAELSRTNLWGFIYLGLIGTGLAYALWFRGIDRLSPGAASYLGLLSPVVATIIGYVFLRETFSVMQIAGVVVVLASVVIGQQANTPEQRSSTHCSPCK